MRKEKRFNNRFTIFFMVVAMLIVLALSHTDVYASSKNRMIVAIKAHNGKYVCAEGGGGREVLANREKIGKWESFEVIDLGDNNFAFKTYNGKYLCAENGGGKEVVANRNEVKEWETFELEYLDDDEFAIKTHNGKYVRAEKGGKIVANRDEVGTLERFKFKKSYIDFPRIKLPRKVALQAYSGKYLCAEDGGGEEICATSSKINNWEKFRVIQSSDGRIALRVHNGKYIDVEDKRSGEIEADSSRIDDSSKFKVIDLGNNRVALKAYNGEFLGIENDDKELEASFEEVSNRTIFKLINVDGDNEENQHNTKYKLKAGAGDGYIKFSWNRSNQSNVIGYNLYRGTSSGKQSKTPITDFPIVGTSYTDRNVENNITYYYILKAVYKDNSLSQSSNQVTARPSSSRKKRTITLRVGSKYMTVDGKRREIDPGKGTKLIIKNGRTFLPIRAFVESIGGRVYWKASNKEVRVLLDNKEIKLWIGKKAAKVNGKTRNNDVAPFISDTSRTMIPLRFIVENLGCDVEWDGQTRTVKIEID